MITQTLQERRAQVFLRHALASGGDGPELAVLPPGAFMMGAAPNDPDKAPTDAPRIKITFDAPFAIGRTPVTFDEYARFAEATGRETPCDYGFGRGDRPVINVSWHDATAYCEWLCQETGAAYALPSEAAWEYACRAGSQARFAAGADITTADANFDPSDESDPIGFREMTLPVRSFEPNRWGLYDMHGTVGEWCADGWSNSHKGADRSGAPRPFDIDDPMHSVVVRGGGWSTKKRYIRASERWHYAPSVGFEMIGFRVFLREL